MNRSNALVIGYFEPNHIYTFPEYSYCLLIAILCASPDESAKGLFVAVNSNYLWRALSFLSSIVIGILIDVVEIRSRLGSIKDLAD
jgi:hypothetical protein